MPIPKSKYNVGDEVEGELGTCKIISKRYEGKDSVRPGRYYEVEYYNPYATLHEEEID